MITVHHLENSRSQRVLWLLEELAVPYEVKRYQRDAKTNLAPSELKAVHPLGKSPVITDGDLVIAESGAITEYLIEAYGQGAYVPKAGTADKRRYTYWMHAAEGSVMNLLVLKLVLTATTKAPVPFFIRPITKAVAKQVNQSYTDPSIKAMLAYMEAELSQSAWFAGDELSGADFQMMFPVEAAAQRVDLSQDYPHLQAWLAKVQARPAYQRALETGGPYQLLG